MKTISLKDWLDKGNELFGSNPLKWIFVCPKCKTKQTLEDLLDLGVAREELDEYTGFSCIGRLNRSKKGCDWTLGGLLGIHTLEVELPNGNTRPCFEFAKKKKE